MPQRSFETSARRWALPLADGITRRCANSSVSMTESAPMRGMSCSRYAESLHRCCRSREFHVVSKPSSRISPAAGAILWPRVNYLAESIYLHHLNDVSGIGHSMICYSRMTTCTLSPRLVLTKDTVWQTTCLLARYLIIHSEKFRFLFPPIYSWWRCCARRLGWLDMYGLRVGFVKLEVFTFPDINECSHLDRL